MVLFIICIFTMSSIAYVMTGFSPQQEGLKFPESFIIDYELNPFVENELLARGFTIFKINYTVMDPMLEGYIDNLPETYTTSYGNIQVIVQKLLSNQTSLVVTGPYDEVIVDNITRESILDSLCRTLFYTPPECGLLNITD